MLNHWILIFKSIYWYQKNVIHLLFKVYNVRFISSSTIVNQSSVFFVYKRFFFLFHQLFQLKVYQLKNMFHATIPNLSICYKYIFKQGLDFCVLASSVIKRYFWKKAETKLFVTVDFAYSAYIKILWKTIHNDDDNRNVFKINCLSKLVSVMEVENIIMELLFILIHSPFTCSSCHLLQSSLGYLIC